MSSAPRKESQSLLEPDSDNGGVSLAALHQLQRLGRRRTARPRHSAPRLTQRSLLAVVRRASVPLFVIVNIGMVGFGFSATRAATLILEDSAMVNDTVIRLGDVGRLSGASVPEALAGLVVGEAAPAGHFRFMNAEEIAQRISRAYPRLGAVMHNGSRIRVATDAAQHTVGEYESVVADYVTRSTGVPAQDLRIALQEPSRSFRCLRKPFTVDVAGLKPGVGAGCMTLDLTIRQGTRTTTVPVGCKVAVWTSVAVASRDIARGEAVNNTNCSLVRKELSSLNLRPCRSLEELNGKRARRTILRGTMVCSQHLEMVPLVTKDQQVTMAVTSGAIRIAMTLVARESGHQGQTIWVENPQSRALLRARVVGEGLVAPMSKGDAL